MTSPALNWKARFADQATRAVVAVVAAVDNNRLALMVAALGVALSELSGMKTLADRQAAKRGQYLPQFEDFIDDYLSGTDVFENPVLVWFTLWLFDVRDIGRALAYADICIAQGQPMPDGWRRNMQTHAADEVLDWVNETLMDDSGAEVNPHFQTVRDRVLSGEWNVHEAVQVKYAKMAAHLLDEAGDIAGAVIMYQTAQRIAGGNAGVKTRLEQLLKELARLEAEKTNTEGSPA